MNSHLRKLSDVSVFRVFQRDIRVPRTHHSMTSEETVWLWQTSHAGRPTDENLPILTRSVSEERNADHSMTLRVGIFSLSDRLKHWPGHLFRAFVLTSVCLVCCSGCSYPQIGEKAYEISKALYTTCNLKRSKDLDKVSELIRQAAFDSELSESESELLLEVVQKAKDGQWEAAEQKVRSILEDQTDL